MIAYARIDNFGDEVLLLDSGQRQWHIHELPTSFLSRR